jgi:hypothetical protein
LSKTASIALTVTQPVITGPSASFLGADTVTQGTWSEKYGRDGFVIANGASAIPGYANVSFNGASTYTWAGLTSDIRALQSSRGDTARIASSYYSNSSSGFNFSLGFNDGAAHQVAIYLLDWDTTSRAETIAITDVATGALLDSRSFSGFHNGVECKWQCEDQYILDVTEPRRKRDLLGPV